MPTLENELESLKQALSVLQSRHISDVKQLNDRIDRVQQQIDEQRKRLFDQGVLVTQRFDALEKALVQQFDVINQNFLRLEQQGKRQTEELKEKFAASDSFAATTYGLVLKNQDEIRVLNERLTDLDVNQRFADLNQEMYSGFESIGKRLDTHDRQFEAQGQKLDQILSLLTSKPE